MKCIRPEDHLQTQQRSRAPATPPMPVNVRAKPLLKPSYNSRPPKQKKHETSVLVYEMKQV